MLQHEPQEQEQPAPPPAAQIRVTSEELAQAINALEASKDEAARHLAGTVPIGEVVAELKLEATPEEVWAQVQRQRAQAAQAQAAQEEARRVRPVAVPVPQDVRVRQRARGWRRAARGWWEIKGWLWILFWCCGGLGLVTSALHPSHTTTPAGIQVKGDGNVHTYLVHHEDAAVEGDANKITLRGDVQRLTVDGDHNTVTVISTVEAVTVDNDGNTVHWTKEPPGKTIHPIVDGDGNHVGLSVP